MRHLPPHFSEYREPFVGGGSVFIHLRQKFPRVPMWINDLNFDLFCFWKETQRDAEKLAARVREMKTENPNGRVLFETLRAQLHTSMSDLERAARFFILNRISFSGTVDSGGYSQGAFHGRFTDSSIARFVQLGTILRDVKITHNNQRAIAAGLHFRPIAETIRDTLLWDASEGAHTLGLSREREQELLRAWHKQE